MKKRILSAFLTFALALTLWPGTVAAAVTSDGGEYAVTDVSAEGALVNVRVTAADDCALFVGLYEESGRMTAVRSRNVTKTTGDAFSVSFDGAIGADVYAKAFLLSPDALAPLCESRDSRQDEFHAEQYALIERITIEDIHNRYVSSALNGNPPSDVAAVIRLSNGARRTVALDDSKNYRDSEASVMSAILPAFRAGRIVRFASGDNGYHLYAVDDAHLTLIQNFALRDQRLFTGALDTPAPVVADAETHFVVEDTVRDTYKAYVGIAAAPDIQVSGAGAFVSGAMAYVYHVDGVAKLIFVTNATRVSDRDGASPDDGREDEFPGEDGEFHAEQYALIERITIENKNGAYASSALNGNPPSDVAAVIRLSNGARRTVALDDSKNYRDSEASVMSAILPAFRAGRIVRFASGDNGYHLYAVDDAHLTLIQNFALHNKRLFAGDLDTSASVFVDAETHFVVEDTVSDTYKSYVGIAAAPDIQVSGAGAFVSGATAYVYHIYGLAKLIFVTNATRVVVREPSSPVGDKVTFLAAPSVSNRVSSNIGDYYEVYAVVNGEIRTVAVKDGVSFSQPWSDFTPGADGQNTAWNCVILNEVTYDANDLITAGTFSSDTSYAYRAQGVQYVNEREIRVDTFTSGSYLVALSENAKAYFVNQSGDIQRIAFDDTLSDAADYDTDYIYYVQEGGQITDLFIVDYTPSAA